jgi:predicted ribosome-associated RNA-binding protein Tma20
MPLIRSEASKSENQRGGMLQVAVIMCETLSSILSEFNESAFSISLGRKKLLIVNGIEDLKSSKADLHLVAVDHGAMYFLLSISKMCAPSNLRAGGSVTIVRLRALCCSSLPVGVVVDI